MGRGACAIAPAVAYGLLATQEKSAQARRYFLALLAFASLVPLELYLTRWQADFALQPLVAVEAFGPGALLWVLCLATAAPAIALAKGRTAQGFTAIALAALTAFATDAAGTASAAVAPPVIGAETKGPRHIILLSADTLRADAIEPYDSSQRTPSLQTLSRDSVVFKNAFAPAPWTLPSVTSMLTGLSPEVHGVGLGLDDAALPTLAERLADNGYRTASFIGNPILIPGAPVLDARNATRFEFYRGVQQWRVFG